MATNHGRPATDLLLLGLREHLERTVQPRLSGAEAYRNRIAVSLLRMLEREMVRSHTVQATEHARLTALLGVDGDLEALNAELARRIRTDEIDYRHQGLLDHLDRTVIDCAAIDSPEYSAYLRASQHTARA